MPVPVASSAAPANELVPVPVSWGGIQLDPDEAIAELVAEQLEPLLRHQLVTGKTQAQDAQALVLGPRLDPGPVRRRDLDVRLAGGAESERE